MEENTLRTLGYAYIQVSIPRWVIVNKAVNIATSQSWQEKLIKPRILFAVGEKPCTTY